MSPEDLTKCDQLLDDYRRALEYNFHQAMTAFQSCPPQNPREVQVCETVRSSNFLFRDLAMMLKALLEHVRAQAKAPTHDERLAELERVVFHEQFKAQHGMQSIPGPATGGPVLPVPTFPPRTDIVSVVSLHVTGDGVSGAIPTGSAPKGATDGAEEPGEIGG